MEIKFVVDGELRSEIIGPVFDGIVSNWYSEYFTKIKNCSGKKLNVFSYCNFSKTLENQNLSREINVELSVNGKPVGKKKSFNKWKLEGFEFDMDIDEVVDIKLVFTTEELRNELQGITGEFDFEFGIMEEVNEQKSWIK